MRKTCRPRILKVVVSAVVEGSLDAVSLEVAADSDSSVTVTKAVTTWAVGEVMNAVVGVAGGHP